MVRDIGIGIGMDSSIIFVAGTSIDLSYRYNGLINKEFVEEYFDKC